MPELFDTHCHIHEAVRQITPVYDKWHKKGSVEVEQILADAKAAGVNRILCIGTTLADSEQAIEFANQHQNIWASIGIHPHEAAEAHQKGRLDAFARLATAEKVVAVGECGLDYYYEHSPKETQLQVLRFQLELASKHNLPLSFHVRDAFDDFWPVFAEYKGVRGVLHSFTDSVQNMQKAVKHGLFIGVNGIATFTKDPQQIEMYRSIPLENLLLETDAPFLTPTPYRGNICEPKHVLVTAEFVANQRGEPLERITAATTMNARQLFGV